MPQDALPDRFTVDLRGTPGPPSASYYVVDMVNDYDARCALWMLVRMYRRIGAHVRADELEKALIHTEAANTAAVLGRSQQTARPTGRAGKTRS